MRRALECGKFRSGQRGAAVDEASALEEAGRGPPREPRGPSPAQTCRQGGDLVGSSLVMCEPGAHHTGSPEQ